MNSHNVHLISNILALLSGTLVGRALKFFLFVYAARVFGPEDYGRFSYVMVFALLSVIAVGLGVSRYLVQQLSRDDTPTSRYLGHNLLLNWALGALITGGTTLYFYLCDPRPDMAPLAALLVGGNVRESVAGCYHSIFQAQRKMVAHSFLISAGLTACMLFGFVTVFATRDLVAFAAIHPLTTLINLLLSWGLARRRGIRASLRFDPALMRTLIRRGLPFSLTSVFIFIYYHIGSLFLEHFHGSESVGHYNAAYRLVEVPLVFLSSITLALFPTLSHLDAHDREQLRATTQEAIKLALLFSLPGALAVCWDAEAMTRLIYGEEYAATAPALAILVLSVAVIFPNAMLGTLLRGIGRQGVCMGVTAAGALFNTLFNLLFIPRYGLCAAAAAALATELLIGAVYWQQARKHAGIRIPLRLLAGIALISATIPLQLWLFAELPLFVRFVIAGANYLLLLQLTGLFPWRMLKHVRIRKG